MAEKQDHTMRYEHLSPLDYLRCLWPKDENEEKGVDELLKLLAGPEPSDHTGLFGILKSPFNGARHRLLRSWFTARLYLIVTRIFCLLSISYLGFSLSRRHLPTWVFVLISGLVWLVIQGLVALSARFSLEAAYILSRLRSVRVPWAIVIAALEERHRIVRRVVGLYLCSLVTTTGSIVFLILTKGFVFTLISTVLFVFIVLSCWGAFFSHIGSMLKRLSSLLAEHSVDQDELTRDFEDLRLRKSTWFSSRLKHLVRGTPLRLPSKGLGLLLAFDLELSAVVTVMALVLIIWIFPKADMLILQTVSAIILYVQMRAASVILRRRLLPFKSIAFRRFDRSTDLAFRRAIAPTLGNVGRCVALIRSELDKGWAEEFVEFSAEVPVGFKLFVPQRGLTAQYVTLRYRDNEWRRRVLEFLGDKDAVDAAVIDVTRASENVLWEVHSSFEHLPIERILFVAEGGDFSFFDKLLQPENRLRDVRRMGYRRGYLAVARLKCRIVLWLMSFR